MFNNVITKNIPRKMLVLDVGARDGLCEPFSNFDKSTVTPILVEPDKDEAKRLSKVKDNDSEIILPYALWDKSGELTLNINKSPGTSSIFKPNFEELDKFPECDRFLNEKKVKLEGKTICELVANGVINDIDFMKVDVQGGELQVIRGGGEFLKDNLIGIEVEVEFLEMYKNQPLFGDVEKYIRTHLGLELWDIKKYYWKYKTKKNMGASTKGRVIFADVLFFRPLTGIDDWLSEFTLENANEKLYMLLLTLSVYGYYDYIEALLESEVGMKYLDVESHKHFSDFLEKNDNQLVKNKYKSFFVYKIFYTLAKLFEPNHHGWSAADPLLGNKKKYKFWW
jgi:FkbM family methyltransferase